ncbi:hypothetical protein MMC25_005117 [Agyrium rufum]|nr:hypothetical protein [Agyrium rufum]
MSEKDCLIPQPPRRDYQESARRGRTLVTIFGLASICWTTVHLYAFLAIGTPPWTDERPISHLQDQCPQVEPLFPANHSPALDLMDKFILSNRWRNETISHLTGAVQIPSESYDDMPPVGQDDRWNIFFEIADYMKKTFPEVHKTLELEKVNTHGLLFTWHGSDESLKPTVLMAHQDVVPVAKSTVSQWTYPPYSGHYDGKYIWGRGVSDCKNTLIGIMEAVELLIIANFKPKRTLILSFGFDEETLGFEGAGHLAPVLLERYGEDGVSMIIDEGSGVGNLWGSQFAMPATAEKGYIDVEIVVRMPGGHSSIPPAHNGIGVMSELITTIEANPYESHIHTGNPMLGMLACGAAHSPDFPPKLRGLLDHRDSNDSGKDELALEVAEISNGLKYLVTTSVAPDVIEGGVKNNALPERTRLLVNHRVNIGDHTSVVKDKLTSLAETVANKYNLTLHAFDDEAETPRSITLRAEKTLLEPAPVTPTSVDGVTPYGILSGTTRALYGSGMLMSPGSSTGNTDTKEYWALTKHIFRYGPGWDPEDDKSLGRIHTVDERLSVKNHIKTVQWYSIFIQNVDEASLP